jgi:DNA repair ATPase RecN
MAQKIKLDDAEYEVENLSEQAKAYIATLKFTDTRLQELTNMRALLQRAKNSYVDSLKKEMLSSKAGFLFDDE